MSAGIFSTINPNTTSGTQLATILDDFKDAIVSGFSGTTRPSNLQAYGYWIDTTNVGSGILEYKMYDGSSDVTVLTINKDTGQITFPGIEDEFTVQEISDSNVGPKLVLEKKRATGGGQSLTNDVLGDVDFEGNDDGAITYVQARIRSVTTDNTSSTTLGSYMQLLVTPTGNSGLVEALRLTGDKRLGVDVSSPTKTLDINATDDSAGIQTSIEEDSTSAPEIIIQKRRVTGSGQVLIGDDIGSHIFKSVDQNGADIEVARMDVSALENHTDAAQGVSFILSVKDPTTTSFVEALKINDGEAFLYGEKVEGTKPSENLQSGTNSLITVDSTKYGAFKLHAFIHGSGGSGERQQEVVVKGVYDFDNSTWKTSTENDSMGNSDYAVTIAITDAATLAIDYTNNIPSFTSGKIYKSIKRFAR